VNEVPDEMHLSADSIEALASRLAEFLGGASPAVRGGSEEMLDAAEVGRRWGISRRWIYDHADDVGAMRMGGGPRPRLRFDPAEVAERLGAPRSIDRPRRVDVRRSPRSVGTRGSDSISPPTRATFVESRIAAGGHARRHGGGRMR